MILNMVASGGGLTLSNAKINSTQTTNTIYTVNSPSSIISTSMSGTNLVHGQAYILKYNGTVIGYGIGDTATMIKAWLLASGDTNITNVVQKNIELYEVN